MILTARNAEVAASQLVANKKTYWMLYPC